MKKVETLYLPVIAILLLSLAGLLLRLEKVACLVLNSGKNLRVFQPLAVVLTVFILLRGAFAAEPFTALAAAFLAALVRPWQKWRKERSWRARLRSELPLLLDLTYLALRSGLGLAPALARSVEVMPSGPLCQEMAGVLSRQSRGQTLTAALADCARRLDLEEFWQFQEAVALSLEIGADLSRSIAAQAAQQRRLAFLRQERFAQTAPLRMMLPLFLCIFPGLFLLIFGPLYFQYGASFF